LGCWAAAGALANSQVRWPTDRQSAINRAALSSSAPGL
jgi:hypothetical protein